MSEPRICFGQQPCGFFPRRFLFAKIMTARRLREELGGGEIVFFCHDSDHDPRETQTILRHKKTDERTAMNFAFANKVQRKWTPLHRKLVSREWQANTARQLPAYVDDALVRAFKETQANLVADFCLEMYARMGLLDGVRIVRSSDPAVRGAACEPRDFFVDVPHAGEIVRARWREGALQLHEGGDRYVTLPETGFTREQISPSRDTRLRWMQSVVQCTHYVAGAGEIQYMRTEETPEITFVPRDAIERPDEAHVELDATR